MSHREKAEAAKAVEAPRGHNSDSCDSCGGRSDSGVATRWRRQQRIRPQSQGLAEGRGDMSACDDGPRPVPSQEGGGTIRRVEWTAHTASRPARGGRGLLGGPVTEERDQRRQRGGKGQVTRCETPLRSTFPDFVSDRGHGIGRGSQHAVTLSMSVPKRKRSGRGACTRVHWLVHEGRESQTNCCAYNQ